MDYFGVALLTGAVLVLLCPGSLQAGAHSREAYFNGTSYLRMQTPVSLRKQTGLSFRSCVGGELFTQRYLNHSIQLVALADHVLLTLKAPGRRAEARLPLRPLDNHWHYVQMAYRAPELTLSDESGHSVVVANATYNSDFLQMDMDNEAAVLLVGSMFSGCMLEGPGLVFNTSTMTPHNVLLGRCPLSTDKCVDRRDVLKVPPVDHCYHEPCMRHGVCISRPDRYECHCSARYSGNNCQNDNGPPCESAPCLHGGACSEDKQGDYSCSCLPGYLGAHCEFEVSVHPLCMRNPCQNNATCRVPMNSDNYLCTCNPGYTGFNCEINVDDCLSAPQPPCQNGGICHDALNNYTCICTNTGYTGARCEININECELQPGPCLNRGICFDTYGGYVCQCQPGYTGNNCQQFQYQNQNECASSPCMNGGTCEERGGSYHCLCPRGTQGPRCSLKRAPRCVDSDCPPHAHCSDRACVCDQGYVGTPGPSPNCTLILPEHECETNPCNNGGTCTYDPLLDSFNCSCMPGWTGNTCQNILDPCLTRPCLNGGACIRRGSNSTDFTCSCLDGFEGQLCENDVDDCLDVVCPEHQECFDGVKSYTCRCPDGYSGDNCTDATEYCSSDPCVNGTCREGGGSEDYTCVCNKGYTGRDCSEDVDECKEAEGLCNHGICVNTPGSYQCFCTPGYTGERCNVDFDECLSMPCRNNASCLNRIDNFECICPPGFSGKDCSININECDSNPCAAGSTCIDGTAMFSCVCVEGLTGPTCEVNIDDCESSPCLNGGACEDGLNSFTCNCTDTGHVGERCETNIDDCLSAPCVNGALCVDGVKDYSCQCYPGYTGKNCEVDIQECESSPCQYRGVCLERSNVSLYQNTSFSPSHPMYINEELNMLLPQHFYQEFSYANASGFECVCISGITGSHCEVNINECESNPCGMHGTCMDRVGRYECECEEGFEGDHCQKEIDECARFKPCVRGVCSDRRASYFCACESGWGGKNCSILLEGCNTNRCLNGGTCRPWLHAETQHRFNCSCSMGYHGSTCEKITTMSLGGHSYVVVNTSRDEGYDIQFWFKTTLRDGLLAIGKGLTFYILELAQGRLNLHSSLLNKWEGVFIGSGLNNSEWQKVYVAINSSHLVLAANEEQTIYPININEGSNSSHTSFPTTYLGGTVNSLSRLTHGPASFVGCMQDITINGEWVLPDDPDNSTSLTSSPGSRGSVLLADNTSPVALSSPSASWLLYGVQTKCPRVMQCGDGPANPCHSDGVCTDLWTSFHCTCQRPYLGHTCQYNVTAATFGHENITGSLVTVQVHDAARWAVRSIVDISMFLRTRKPNGQVFYLGSKPKSASLSEETFVAASLENGELKVKLQFNQTSEAYNVGGNRLDNGYNHLIQVVRNSTLVQVKLNGSEYFRKPISATGQLDAQVLYLGGPPPPPPPPPLLLPGGQVRAVRQAGELQLEVASPPQTTEYLKGIIQDVQISNGSRTMIVEFFPLQVSDLNMHPSFGVVTFDSQQVLEGVVSDDSCADNPCHHNGTCIVTWNDFRCECTRGFKGKSCQEMEFCQLQDCPLDSHCLNLNDGYECVANATFEGRAIATLSYGLLLSGGEQQAAFVADSISLQYRSQTGGTLLHVEGPEGAMFSMSVFRDQVTVEWRLQPLLLPARVHRMRKPRPDFHWTRVHIQIQDRSIRGGFNDWQSEDSPSFSDQFDLESWLQLLQTGAIYLGGVQAGAQEDSLEAPPPASNTTQLKSSFLDIVGNTNSVDMEGLEYSTERDGKDQDFWKGSEGSVGANFKGCLGEVRIGGLILPYYTQEELYPTKNAEVIPHPSGPRFSLIAGRSRVKHGCALCARRDCRNGGRCAAPATSYACACPPGYAGDDCAVDVDECAAHRCENNSTCIDGVANYTCSCLPGWEGWLCDVDIDECLSSPCDNGGTCLDLPGGFSCACLSEFTGPRCSQARLVTCQHHPCKAGSTCLNQKDVITGNNFTCSCLPGLEGVMCDMAYCVVRPCVNGGICEFIPDTTPICKCPPGFTGRFCEINTDDCKLWNGASPCLHGGRCTDGINSYTCDCHNTGYTGANCEEDVDECLLGLVSCGEGGTCQNTKGSYICVCEAGKCGSNCSLPDPCHLLQASPPPQTLLNVTRDSAAVVSGPCEHAGVCRPLCREGPDYECECVDNWAGKNCTEQLVVAISGEGPPIGAIIGGIVGGLCALGGAALAAACLLARTKRATRGTYSPSGQEYRNPRGEMMDNALKPPPEERLI